MYLFVCVHVYMCFPPYLDSCNHHGRQGPELFHHHQEAPWSHDTFVYEK